jgi:hypothetical protein
MKRLRTYQIFKIKIKNKKPIAVDVLFKMKYIFANGWIYFSGVPDIAASTKKLYTLPFYNKIPLSIDLNKNLLDIQCKSKNLPLQPWVSFCFAAHASQRYRGGGGGHWGIRGRGGD